MTDVTRRGVLARTGAVVGAGGFVSLLGASPAAASAPGARSLELDADGLRVLGPPTSATVGSSHVFRGRLRTAGRTVGELIATRVVLVEPSMFDDGVSLYETHLFRLGASTLTGSGVVHHDGTGEFTITGGTGEFAAARGSYTSRHTADHSGSGDGRFTFKIG